MKNFKQFIKESNNEPVVSIMDDVTRSGLTIYLEKSGISLGLDYVYNKVDDRYVVFDEATAQEIIDEIAIYQEENKSGELIVTGPDSIEKSDIDTLNTFDKDWKSPVSLDIKLIKSGIVTEAELTGNLGLPGEDGEGDKFLDKIRREKDVKYADTNLDSLHRELMAIQGELNYIARGKKNQLEKLAKDLIIELYGNVLPDDIEFDIRLVGSGREVASFMETIKKGQEGSKRKKDQEEQEEEDEQQEQERPTPRRLTNAERRKIKSEVDRRKIANLIIQGEALNVKSVIEMPECMDGLRKILGVAANTYVSKVLRLTEIGKQLDWFVPSISRADEMENVSAGFAGACHVDWEKNDNKKSKSGGDGMRIDIEPSPEQEDFKPVLRVVGVDFVMLIHESVKAVYEYLSTPGISKDPEIAQIVKQQTSSFYDELEEFKYGPEVAAELRDFINKNNKVDRYPNTREQVYIKMMEMDTEPFLLLMKGILSGTPSARKQIDEIIDTFISEMEQYERDLMEWEMAQRSEQEAEQDEEEESEIDKLISGQKEEEPESEVLDYSKLSNRELEKLIDDALDREDFKEVEKLSKFLKESKYISILEKHIDKKLK